MPFALAAFFLLVFSGFSGAQDFSLGERRELIARPALTAEPGLLEWRVEPTVRELRTDDVWAAERWQQGFLLAARLPVTEAFSIRQELRAGLQSETIMGDEFNATYRDALEMMERTSAELQASERLRLALTAQQQWLATNQVPFAEIVTYGGEAKFAATKTTTLRLQLQTTERTEMAGAESAQETVRLALEQELVPKRLAAGLGGGIVENDAAENREIVTDASLKWTPLAETTVVLRGERGVRETLLATEERDAWQLKLQQQVFARSKVELQAGYEARGLLFLADESVAGGWNLGATSDLAIREDWSAGLGVRLRDDAATPQPEELSFTLSVKGKF